MTLSMHNDTSRYDVIGEINLLHTDHDPALLYNKLQSLKKDYYSPNEKILVLHNDTEYFYHNHVLGFTTHNLFTCWRDLDIPYHVMLMLTNHSNMHLAVKPFVVDDNDVPTIVSTIVNNCSWENICNVPAFDLAKEIEYPALCLLGAPRSHRKKLMQYLTKHNLFDLVRTNFNSDNYRQSVLFSQSDNVVNRESCFSSHKNLSDIVYSMPHRANQSCFSQSRNKDIVDLNRYPSHPRFDPVLSGTINNFYSKFFLDVAVESVFDYPHVFVSEKTLKPLLFKTPFVLFGAEKTLDHLRCIGFKTFSNFWDESYDNESDPHTRFIKACDQLRHIATQPISKLKQIYIEMQPILDHNRITLLKYVDSVAKPLYNKSTRPIA